MTTTSDSSVYYHDNNRHDPFVTNPQRNAAAADYEPCWACDCTSTLDSEPGCRCSCHSQRRHH